MAHLKNVWFIVFSSDHRTDSEETIRISGFQLLALLTQAIQRSICVINRIELQTLHLHGRLCMWVMLIFVK